MCSCTVASGATINNYIIASKPLICVFCSYDKTVKLSVLCGRMCVDMAQREKVGAADLTTLTLFANNVGLCPCSWLNYDRERILFCLCFESVGSTLPFRYIIFTNIIYNI